MLTHAHLARLKPRESIYRLLDTGGLYIEVRPSGVLTWRFRYRFHGKANMLGLGRYPEVSLKEARNRRDEARALLRDGKDPSEARKQAKLQAKIARENNFQAVAEDWMQRQQVAEVTANKNRWLLETFAYPDLARRPIAEITPQELLTVLRRVEATGKLETAQRLKIKLSQVFRFALIEGKAAIDPTVSLRGALKSPEVTHHGGITDPKRLGDVLRAIDGYEGQPVTVAALKLTPLWFVRPGELRHARWADVDLEARLWAYTVPKTRQDHVVPLARQSLEILNGLQPLTGHGEYVFPGFRSTRRPMSENAVTAALRSLGFPGSEVTAHGFRATARTLLDEKLHYPPHLIEHQLAHTVRDPLGRAYNRTQHLPERRKMMQAWADYLDGLRNGADVVPIGKRRVT